MTPAPLRFHPLLKERVWGTESWEICDRPGDQSVVAEGPLAGRSLRDLVRSLGEGLLGRACFRGPEAPFPLLVKTLEVRDWLSIQVHPTAAAAGPGESAKTEAWYILEAKPGAEILLGIEGALDPEMLPKGLLRYPVRPGDGVLVPAGTPHALGPGIRLAEVQENSDTTYRLYDWGRTSRPLQVEKALAPLAAMTPPPPKPLEELRCPPFRMARRALAGRQEMPSSPERFRILGVMEGAFQIEWGGEGARARQGAWWLIPASLGSFSLYGDALLLEVTP